MRIIAGSLRGRRLSAPPGLDVRPTSDRVREAVFNSLYSMDDALDGGRVADLFAGSGALGLEAISRGASHVTFVEQSRSVLHALRANIEALGVRDRATVVAADATVWTAEPRERFDVAFVDPPYAFDDWPRLLAQIRARIVVVESGREVDPPAVWELVRSRTYGATVVQIFVTPDLPDPPDLLPPSWSAS